MAFSFTLLILGLAAFAINLYNQIVKHENRVAESWSGIDVQLKLRHDLVPNLIALVKKYTQHEQEVLVEVVEKRTSQTITEDAKETSTKETDLSKSLKTLFAVAESYPNLKADKSFLELQENLVKIEDQLQYARRYYNGTVRDYNTFIQSFPNNLIAKMFAKNDKEFFEIERSIERDNPQVSL